MEKVLSHIAETHNKGYNCKILLGGDFNVPEIDWEIPVVKPGCHHKAMCDRLIEITSEHHLEQLQREPTRLDNILDLLFTNKPALVKEVSIMPGLSDHSTVLVDTYLNIKPNIKLPRKINQWSRANWDKMREETRVFREQYFNTTPTQSVDQKSESLTQFLSTLVSKHVPQKVSSSRRNIPWMTPPLHRMCRKKQRLYNKENDTRPFWRYVKSQHQENCGVAPLKSDGQLHPDGGKKAEILNKQFTSVFTSDEEDVNSETTLEGPSIAPIDQIIVSEASVAKMLHNLDTKKACGPHYLPCRLLKELAEELSSIYADIFQCSLDSGELPRVWKTANVALIYKKCPVSEAVNYRPVSLTCIPCKLLEHILCSHIRAHLDRHKALTPLNHGFRSKHSCETQLLLTI